LEKCYFRPRNIPLNLNAQRLIKNNPIEQKQTGESERRLYYSYLPLLVKMYPSGNLTRKLITGDSSKLQLSSLRGEGLRLAETAPGKVIVVAGGTGLFPFSDLINLLFKSTLIKANPLLKAEAATLDPILNENPFEKWAFQFFIAVNHIEDIHPITLAQLIELSQKQGQVSVSLRVKDKTGTNILQNSKIVSTDQTFDVLVQNELRNAFSKVWVCGPPPMNEAMVRLFDSIKLDNSKYLMI
jgi:NAD(P)H-flavin reductase